MSSSDDPDLKNEVEKIANHILEEAARFGGGSFATTAALVVAAGRAAGLDPELEDANSSLPSMISLFCANFSVGQNHVKHEKTVENDGLSEQESTFLELQSNKEGAN